MTRSRLLYMRRNARGLPFLLSLISFFFLSVPKSTALYLLKGKFRLVRSLYQGIGWNIANSMRTPFINLIDLRIRSFKKKNPGVSKLGLLAGFVRGLGRMLLAKIYLRNCTTVGGLVTVNGKPIISNLGEMHIGTGVTIWSSVEKSKLYTGKKGKLIIGQNTRVNGTHIDARTLIQIGQNVHIGPYSVILDSDFHDVKDHDSIGKSDPVIIEDNVWLATRVTILKGVRIGAGSTIAAGAVVTRDIPPNSLAAGVPARVIKKIE